MFKALSDLKKLHESTTQGEWFRQGTNGIYSREHRYHEFLTLDNGLDAANCLASTTWGNFTNNADFIIESHKMIPRLIKALNECRSQRNIYLDQIYGNGYLVEKAASSDDKELEQILEGK